MQKDLDILENMMKSIAKEHPEKLSGYYDENGNWHQTIHVSIPYTETMVKPGDHVNMRNL